LQRDLPQSLSALRILAPMLASAQFQSTWRLVRRIRQYPKMPAPATVLLGTRSGRRHQSTTQNASGGIGEACGNASRQGRSRRRIAALPDRVGQRHQIVVVGDRRQWSGVAHQVPPAWRGDPACVGDAEIPRMRFRDSGQRPDDSGRVGVYEGQRRHGIVRAPRPAAATGNGHASEAIAREPQQPPDTLSSSWPDLEPLRSADAGAGSWTGSARPAPSTPGHARSTAATDRAGLAQ
jgi:hypothetical protein